MKPPIHRIVIYRVRSSFKLGDIDLRMSGYSLVHSKPDEKLYLTSNESDPPWLSYVLPLLQNPSDITKNIRNSFVYLKKVDQRIFALAGGSGYHGVKDYCEEDFGLQVAVRMISENQISAMNQKPLKGQTRSILRSVAGYEPRLDLDNYSRMLQFIQGKGVFEGRTFSVGGRSSLTLRTKRPIKDFSEVAKEINTILAQPEKVVLPKTFRIITDKKLIDELSQQLDSEFSEFWDRRGSRENLYVEFHNPVDQLSADQFEVRIGRESVPLSDFELEAIRDHFKGTPSAKALTGLRVVAQDSDGKVLDIVKNFREALSFETTHQSKPYLKIGKQWVEIFDDAVRYVDEYVSGITVDNSYLPEWEKSFSNEDAYNKSIAQIKNWICCHTENITIKGRSKIELCDLYDPSKKRFIHVKKTWGAKASYLFLQASTSANQYNTSNEFRLKCKKQWPNAFDGTHKHGERFVVIGMAIESKQISAFPANLSYFAKQNLTQAVQLIRASGFDVILSAIKIVS